MIYWFNFLWRTRILQGQWLRDPHRRHSCDCSHTYKGRCSVAAHKLIIGDHVLSTWPWCFYLFISPQYGNNYLTFDIVSLVPYDRKLIDISLLSTRQVMNHLQICKCKKLWIFNFTAVLFIFRFNFRVLYKCFPTLLLQQQNIWVYFLKDTIGFLFCQSFQRKWCHLHDGKSAIFVTFLSFISALWILHNRFNGEGKFWVFADRQRNYNYLIPAQYFQYIWIFLERGCKLQHLLTLSRSNRLSSWCFSSLHLDSVVEQILRDHQDVGGSRAGQTGVKGREGLDAEEHRTLHVLWKFCGRLFFHSDPLRPGPHPFPDHHLIFSDGGAQAADSSLGRRHRPYAVDMEQLNPRDALQFSFLSLKCVCFFHDRRIECGGV